MKVRQDFSRLLLVSAIILLGTSSLSQSVSQNSTLDQLSASARGFAQYIPKWKCQEDIHSERRSTPVSFGPHISSATMNATDVIEVRRVNDRLTENRVWVSQNGQLVPNGTKVVPPYLLNEAFGLPIPAYLDVNHRSCLVFSFTRRGRVDFRSTPLAGRGLCADIPPQAVGFLLFEPSSNRIFHLERSVPIAAAATGGFAPFASVDYRPVRPEGSDGRTFQLPSRITATRQNKGYSLSFEAHYSDCRFYTVKHQIFDAEGKLIPEAQEP